MTRKKLSVRRKCWTQKVRIDGHVFFLTCGEYDDGTLGEVWLKASKNGSYTQGVWDTLARTASLALQHGCPLEEIVKLWQCMPFVPFGDVTGSPVVEKCTSVVDWVSQELRHVYLTSGLVAVRPGEMMVEKTAGYITQGSGA